MQFDGLNSLTLVNRNVANGRGGKTERRQNGKMERWRYEFCSYGIILRIFTM